MQLNPYQYPNAAFHYCKPPSSQERVNGLNKNSHNHSRPAPMDKIGAGLLCYWNQLCLSYFFTIGLFQIAGMKYIKFELTLKLKKSTLLDRYTFIDPTYGCSIPVCLELQFRPPTKQISYTST